MKTVAYLTAVLCAQIADIDYSRWCVPPGLWKPLVKKRNRNRKSLRELARECSVSHEARRVLNRAK